MAKGKLAPAQIDPRDTYFVSRNKSRNPTQTTRPIRQSIIQTMVPPERMPLPPLKLEHAGKHVTQQTEQGTPSI